MHQFRMEMNPYAQTNGGMPQANGSSQHGRLKSEKLRVPTVDEALPFSPFSSIVPFNPNILPLPLSIPTASATAFGKSEDVNSIKRELERLSAGAKNAEHASKRCQQTLQDVQKLLDSDNLTIYSFRQSKQIVKSERSETSPPPSLALSSFARMVFDNTKVQYRYITPESPDGKAKGNPKSAEGRRQSKPVANVNTAQHYQPGQTQHASAALQTPSRSTPHKSTAYVLPVPLTPEQQAQLITIKDPDSAANASAVQRNHATHLSNNAPASLDQKRKGDSVVENLQNLLQSIFQAEDQMQPDTSGDVSMHPNSLFATHDTENGSVLVLQSGTQISLDSSLYKAASHGRLDAIEVDDLVHVQRLCENAIGAMDSGDLRIDGEWSETDTDEWLGRIANAENGLVAARSLVRTMTACPNQKELQSEDLLRGIIAANRVVVESGVIPVVEERPLDSRGEKDASRNPKFVTATENRKILQSLIHAGTKCLKLLGVLFLKTDVDESAISSIEDLCRMLIFAENASTEKDSALGIQSFETMRRSAMDVLAMIFMKYTSQQNYILEQILMSLEKLPATKQSARQFRLADAKPIQLVSALIMRLVQSSATANRTALNSKAKSRESKDNASEPSESGDASDEDYDSEDGDIITGRKKGASKKAGGSLASQAKELEDSARQYANTVVATLLRRAVATSKSSDEPFRKLLDIFTDDFLNVLGSSDWPSAEILLQTLVMRMMGIILNTKSPAPSRTLALELLGVIGSGILDLHFTTRDAARGLETDDAISRRLGEIARSLESNDLKMSDLTAFDGPFRIVIEYLHARGSNDAQLQTARGYLLMQWAVDLCASRDKSADSDDPQPTIANDDVQSKVWNIMQDQHWLEEHSDFPTPSTAQGRLAAKIIACSSKLSKAFDRIFDVILSSMNSEQPTIRSRGLKSVTTLLEKDPSIIDRNPRVLTQILGSLNDSSSLVRDSALVLIEKCIALQPELDVKVYERVISRTTDTAVGVRKRAMRFLKQVYLRHRDNRIRSAIANAVISRIHDTEESVAEIARLIIEEIWFFNFRNSKHQVDRSLDATLHFRSHAALIIQTVNIGDEVAAVLEGLLRSLLSSSKQAFENKQVCKIIISVLFDGIIDNSEIPGEPRQSDILRTLTVFAKASPTLFTDDQLERLEPYAENLTSSDDLDVYHYAITILRHTMPHLSSMKEAFLTKLQTALLSSVAKIPKSELAVVAPCLWTINGLLGNTDRLVKFIRSAIQGVNNHRREDLNANPQKAARAGKLLTIVGQFGKACDLEPFFDSMKDVHREYKGKTVSGLMIEIMCHFTSPKQPLSIREAALESVSAICQSWPKEFLRSDVTNAFETVFRDRVSSLEQVLLTSLEVFFRAQEAPVDGDEAVEIGTGVASGTQRLGGTYVATDQDGASASISQRFLPEFLRIALASCDEVALDAARIVVSINRQGMAHPRESGPSLIALETCPNAAIAKMAFLEHKQLYSKHESVFEKELMRAVQQAFDYQRQVVGSATGYTGQPPVSKLHFFWDVLKSGKTKVRTKFFSSLCAKLDFDPAKLNVNDSTPIHLLFVRFCVEAIAFLDYDRVEEVLQLLSCLERNFATTGTLVAQAIESEVLRIQIGDASALPAQASFPALSVQAVNPKRLRQLSIAAQALSLQYETRSFLRRLWNMQKHTGKQKNAAKDTNRAPTRASNAAALTDGYLRRVNELITVSEDDAVQRTICSQFVELISVDNEVKVASDEGEDAAGEVEFDSQSESGSPGARSRKRKLSSGIDASRKKARPRRSSSVRLFDEDAEDGWD